VVAIDFLRKVLKSDTFCIKLLLWDNLRGFGYFMEQFGISEWLVSLEADDG
jgi:hypothetical protein